MKLITAVFKPYVLEEVRHALNGVGIHRMTADDVVGYGREGGHTETHRGIEYTVDSAPKRRIEIVVADEDVEPAINAILNAASSHDHGDGKIWVMPVESFHDIRTGDSGHAAF